MLLVLLSACDRGPWEGKPEAEIAAWDALIQTPIGVTGRVVDSSGDPVSGAAVSLHGVVSTTGGDGSFRIEDIPRCNDFLRVSAPGFHAEEAPLHLVRPLDQVVAYAGDVPLSAVDPDRVRMLFTGDVIFGRRFVDTDESSAFDEVPPDDPTALIQSSDPYPGSTTAFDWVGDYLDGYDYVSVNLESVVTSTPDTPHPTKPYVFFTFPESAEALAEWADYANLGNNHVYDYLEPGIQDTFDGVEGAGLGHAGLGFDSEQAFEPWKFELSEQRFAMLSMTSVTGSQYDIGFVASEERGGAADLTDDAAVEDAIAAAWITGRTPIVQAHFGKEYAESPSSYTESRLELLGGAQPGLIVGHHPHTPQGFGWHDGVLAAHSLGNFIFDQDRLETMLGLLFEVEFSDELPVAARTRPIYLEDYRPRAICGHLASWLLRKVGAASIPYDATLTLAAGSAHLDFGEGAVAARETLSIDVEIPDSGVAIVDLREHLDWDESVVFVRSDGADLSARMGRDQLMFGGFEDYDVDEQLLEASRWDLGADSQFVCVDQPFAGVGAMCSLRDRWNTADSKAWFRNRVRVIGDALGEPNKDMTLFSYRRGVDAGRTFFAVEYLASEGERTFGGAEAAVLEAGSYDWIPVWEDLDIPEDESLPDDPENNARAVRIVFHHSPPKRGKAFAVIDEVALINWFEPQDLAEGFALEAPNAEEFLRLDGPPGDTVVYVTVERSALF